MALAVIGVGGWQLLPSGGGDDGKPINVGTTDVVTSLDPAGAYDAGSWALFNNLYQSLMTFDPSSTKPVGDAAKSCGFVGGDLTTYRCQLRSGLTFSNGDKMTAQDVKFSIERVIQIKDGQGPSPLLTNIKSVDAKGQTVTFHLSGGDATFPDKLATGAGAIVDHRVYSADKLHTGNTAVGSGPYTLKSYKPGVSAELQPNPHYQGAIAKTGSPVDVKYYKTPQALEQAWNAKQVDVVHRSLPPSMVASLDPASSTMRVTESDSPEIRNLVFNVRKGTPTSNVAVRKAVAAVIDRDKIATKVYDSTVDPLYSLIPQGITSHTTPFFDTDPKPDPAKAKQLLQSAGVQTPVTFTLAYSPGDETDAEAAEIREELQATGLFKVKVIAKAWTPFQEGYNKGEFDAYTIGWLPDYPDPDDFISPLVGQDSTLHNDYNSAQVDQLITATQQYSNRGQASADFATVQQTLAQDVPIVPLWQKKDYVISTESITGSQYLSDGTGIWRLWELGRI